LIRADPRAKLQLKILEIRFENQLDLVLAKNEQKVLVPIGNHRLGTAFLNGEELISKKLVRIFDQVASGFEGFYFGRFDIRCRDREHLYQGDFQIMELNGAGAEPSHIYHPGASIWDGYQTILYHLRILYKISALNRKAGFKYMTLKEGLKFLGKVRQYKKQQITFN